MLDSSIRLLNNWDLHYPSVGVGDALVFNYSGKKTFNTITTSPKNYIVYSAKIMGRLVALSKNGFIF